MEVAFWLEVNQEWGVLSFYDALEQIRLIYTLLQILSLNHHMEKLMEWSFVRLTALFIIRIHLSVIVSVSFFIFPCSKEHSVRAYLDTI